MIWSGSARLISSFSLNSWKILRSRDKDNTIYALHAGSILVCINKECMKGLDISAHSQDQSRMSRHL